MTDINELPEWVEGAEYPEAPKGWHKMLLKDFIMKPQDRRIWLKVNFDSGNGVQAQLSQNIFTHPEDDGEATCNKITFGKLRQLWEAAGLPETDFPPATNPRAVAKQLNQYAGSLFVDVSVGQDSRGYTEAKRFRKVKEAPAA